MNKNDKKLIKIFLFFELVFDKVSLKLMFVKNKVKKKIIFAKTADDV